MLAARVEVLLVGLVEDVVETGTGVSEVATAERDFVWLTATNLAFGSANSIAFAALGCWSSRMMTEISGVCSVKLEEQSCHSHCQTPCSWQGKMFMEVLRCSVPLISPLPHTVGQDCMFGSHGPSKHHCGHEGEAQFLSVHDARLSIPSNQHNPLARQ